MPTKPDPVDEALAEMPVSNLRRKLSHLRELIPKVAKQGTAPEKMGGYSFMRAEDVCGDIGDQMCVMGISMVPTRVNVVSHQIVDGRASHVVLTVAYRFIDADSTEFIDIEAAGEGKDFGDKAVPKALTGAKKYALTQALTMRVGDDSEADDLSKHDGGKGTAPVQATTKPSSIAGGSPTAASKTGPTITQKQRNMMFAIAEGDTELIRSVQKQSPWFRDRSDHILMAEFNDIIAALRAAVAVKKGGGEPVTTEEDIPF